MRALLDLPRPIKRLIPPQLKRPARAWVLAYTFRKAMRQLTKLQPGEIPSRELLANLRLGWDNQGWDAKFGYMEEIMQRVVSTKGPILECGSGLSTVLMGHLAGKRGIEIWALEHNAAWYQRVSSTLKRYQIPGVKLSCASLRDYTEFHWYDPPLAEMPAKFSLVICDGPPNLAQGARYGLLPILGHRLESGTVILFDDAREPGQQEVLRRWADENGVNVELRETAEVSFALVTCP